METTTGRSEGGPFQPETSDNGTFPLRFYTEIVRNYIGSALNHADKFEAVGELNELLDELDEMTLDPQEIIEGINTQIAASVTGTIQQHLGRHRTMAVSHRKLLWPTSDEDGPDEWKDLKDPETIDQAQKNIASFRIEDITDHDWLGTIDESLDDPRAPSSLLEAEEKFKDTLKQLVFTVNESMPELRPPESSLTRRFGAKLLKNVRQTAAMQLEAYNLAFQDPETINAVNIAAYNLISYLAGFAADPVQFLYRELVGGREKEIQSLAKTLTDQYIGELHALTIDLTEDSGREQRMQTYVKSEQVELTDTAKPAVKREARSIQTNYEPAHVGNFHFDFSWSENTELPVSMVRGTQQDIFIVKAQERSLARTAERLHRDMGKNKEGKDKIDLTIETLARRMSDGIMPWQNTNSVKRISNNSRQMKADYHGLTIWYSFDISPNSPRVYFTVSDVPAMLQSQNARSSKLLIILAETDKANQLDALGRFTTVGRSNLRGGGAGSI